MKTGNFLKLLEKQAGKELIFEYRNQQFVPKAYHITEVKNLQIESVDCGGFEHSDQQTVVQLWVTDTEKADRYMTTAKAKKIFDIVESKRPMQQDAEIFFEYGDATTPTSVYKITAIEEKEGQLIVQLYVPPTECKPRQLLQTVGIEEGCCTPAAKGCC